jgi:cbb3-type cytochrome oxidase maturation protein
MGFYLSWILLVAISIWIGLLALFWGLRGGQFSDQERARFLPLADEHFKPPSARAPWKGKERYAFIFMAAMVFTVLCAAIYSGLRA